MTTRKELDAQLHDATNAKNRLAAEKAHRLAAFKSALDIEYAPREKEAASAVRACNEAIATLVAAEASHPLEGRKVVREDVVGRPGTYKTVERYGVIVVIRSRADYPPEGDLRSRALSPMIGTAIIQQVNAKGKKLTKWDYLGQSTVMPTGWKLVEDVTS